MAQKQLDVARLEEITSVQWEDNQVICQLREPFSLVVKRYKQEVYILLRSGSKVIKLPPDIFYAICQSQVSIAYLTRHLLENGQETRGAWLCCYCGLQFVTEAECQQHEDRHTSDVCFYANALECLDCIHCNRMNNYTH